MIEIIGQLADYLNSRLYGVTAVAAFENDYAASPLLEPKVFISAEGIRNGELDFRVSVYFPVAEGAQSCQTLAEGILSFLIEDDSPVNPTAIEVGAVNWKRDALAFSVDVKGTITNSEQRRCYFTADRFSNRSGVLVSCGITNYSVVRSFGIHPIMTIFSDIPEGVTDAENVYTIVLKDVPVFYIYQLADYGTFRLKVGGIYYNLCYCEKSEEDASGFGNVTVKGYMADYESDQVPVPIPQS